jgi:homoserine kinase type II
MKKIEGVSPQQFEEYRELLTNTKKIAENAYLAIESQVLYDQINTLFNKYYDLGHIKEIYEVFGGYTNRSFGVITTNKGEEKEFFIRKYKAEIRDTDVLIEHSLIKYALAQGFQEAAGIFPATDGRTFIRLNERKNGQTVSRVFSIYQFLQGLDKYTWIDNKSTPQEFFNLGALLARFHGATHGFRPQSDQVKTEPKVRFLIPDLKRRLSERANQPLNTLFHAYFTSTLPTVLDHIDKNLLLDSEYDAFPEGPIHGDYHAGNVKFDGEETVGLFDFDWSKIDIRLFDVCLGIVYCCSSWDMATDGHLRIDDCRNFLNGYNSALAGSTLPALTEQENKAFLRMLANAHIYLVYWLTELWYYLDAENINDYEAISYMNHFIRGLSWLEANVSELEALVKK